MQVPQRFSSPNFPVWPNFVEKPQNPQKKARAGAWALKKLGNFSGQFLAAPGTHPSWVLSVVRSDRAGTGCFLVW